MESAASFCGAAVALAPPLSLRLPRKCAAARCRFPLSSRPPPKLETYLSVSAVGTIAIEDEAAAAAAAAADGDMTAGSERCIELLRRAIMMREVDGGLIPDPDLPDDHQTTAVIVDVKSPMGTTNTNLPKYRCSFPICGAGTSSRGLRFKQRCRGVRCLKNDGNAAAASEVEEQDGEKAATGFTTVMKFEGSSVRSAERMAKLADLVVSRLTKDKEWPIVLLSAMGNTANNLIQAGKKAVSFAFSSVSEIQEVSDIMDLHLRTIDELGLDISIISGLFDELEHLLKRIASRKALTQAARNELASIGECMSTTIFAACLNKLGKIKARQYGAFDIGLDLSGANIHELTCAAVVKRLLEDWSVEPAIPIVAGSLGKGWKSDARGGNDLIAAAIGKALGLSEIQVWKDVDGLLTYDNKYVTFESEDDLQIIKYEDLDVLTELGSGAYGTVYLAKWRGSDVAVKFLKKDYFIHGPSMQEKLEHEFRQEAKILSKLRHPNVLPFYGVVLDGPGGALGTVTEFLVDGSLWHVLQHKAKYLDGHKRLIIALDAALGMEYMHSRGIVHFDFKSANLLVNFKDETRPICKVGDFGLSKIKKNTWVSGLWIGTLPWMAPELMNGSNEVSEKVDVYSYGIFLWELNTGEVPYNSRIFNVDSIISGVRDNTLRPQVPENCDPEWRMLMEQCWAHDPAQRPDSSEIVRRLLAMSTAANYSEVGVI